MAERTKSLHGDLASVNTSSIAYSARWEVVGTWSSPQWRQNDYRTIITQTTMDPVNDGWADNAFVQARHAAAQTPQRDVEALVRRATGSAPVSLARIVRGYDNEVYEASDPLRERALTEAGALLARLHTVTVGGYWRPDSDGAWPTRDKPTLMAGFVAERRAERVQLRQAGFADAAIDQMLGFLEEFARIGPDQPPALCHGDFTHRRAARRVGQR